MTDREQTLKNFSGLEALISNTEAQLRQLQFNSEVVRIHRNVWRDFLNFSVCAEEDRFSITLVESFLAANGVSIDTPAAEMDNRKRFVRVAMRKLTEFSQHGWIQKHSRSLERKELSTASKSILLGFVGFCRDILKLSPETIILRERTTAGFLCFLEAHQIHQIEDIQPSIISAFFRSRSYYAPNTLSSIASHLRSLFRYLCMQGYDTEVLSDHLPKIRFRREQRVPSVWKKDDVDKVLSVVDRGSPIGKRDYAVLLLAARLGMRPGDIRCLRLENLNWDRSCIEIVQAKTGRPLCLPMSEEIGCAIIDYLQNGRPKSDYREVFLRHLTPFTPIGNHNNFHAELTKYRQRAGVKIPRLSRRGLRALRHSLASRLLEVETPLQNIAGVLGHASLETTRMYAKIDINRLRQVALDPEELHHA